MPRPRKSASPFRYFNSSPNVIRLVVMMYVRFPLSLRNVRCSPQTYAGSGSAGCADSASGSGTSTKCT
jgi:hypothetical protein